MNGTTNPSITQEQKWNISDGPNFYARSFTASSIFFFLIKYVGGGEWDTIVH